MHVITYDFHNPIVQTLVKKDADLKPLFKAINPVRYVQWEDPFAFMVYTVISQQISIAVADVLYARLIERLDGDLTPHNVLTQTEQSLLECGLSRAKVVYVKAVAKAMLDGILKRAMEPSLSLQEAKGILLKIRGIGPWSVDMFMMFVVGHEDIFALGDLALRQALASLKRVDASDLKRLEKIVNAYKPYRSIVAHALWQHREG